jgi:hypothetical protein
MCTTLIEIFKLGRLTVYIRKLEKVLNYAQIPSQVILHNYGMFQLKYEGLILSKF